jgi:hypothetical protein
LREIVRSLFSQNEKFGLRGFFTSPIFFIHEDEFFFSQKEKFGLMGFFTSPIFFIHEDEFFSHKRRNLDLGISSQVQFFIHEMEGGVGG